MAKVKVIKENCIGCGMCTGICPNVFQLGDDGLSENKLGDDKELSKDVIDDVKDAAESCPTSSIEFKE